MSNSGDYTIGREGEICGQDEAVTRRYHKYIGKSGNTWLVADQPNAADNIYVTNRPDNLRGEGFGGAVLPMPLVDGGVFHLRGGWHTNSDALYSDTGVDARDKCLTFVVISRSIQHEGWTTIMHNVVYQDERPTIGNFYRGKEIAQRLANEMQCELKMYSKSKSGSSIGETFKPERIHAD